MVRASFLIIAAVGVTSPGLGHAQTFQSIPDFAPALISFDVEGGLVEAWSRYLPCEANVATFRAKILQPRLNPEWNSQIRVSLSNNSTVDRKFENYDPAAFDEAIAVTLVSETNGLPQYNSFAVIEQQKKDAQGLPVELFPTSVKNNRDYSVELRWGPNGEVSASIDGGPTLTMKMAKRVTTLSIFTSGAKTEVRDLQIGRYGPAPKGNEACAIS